MMLMMLLMTTIAMVMVINGYGYVCDIVDHGVMAIWVISLTVVRVTDYAAEVFACHQKYSVS